MRPLQFNAQLLGNTIAAALTAILLLACAAAPIPARAQQDFFPPSDGTYPDQPLTLGADGSFYGTAPTGGQYYYGTVYRFTPHGDNHPYVLHSFTATDGDGADPEGSPVQDESGNLYGATHQGGVNNTGTLYTITADGHYHKLYDFPAYQEMPSRNIKPVGALVEYAPGQFAGATFDEALGDAGSLFTFSIDASGPVPVLTKAPEFTGLYDKQNGTYDKGVDPNGGLVLGPGNLLYGTAERGGIDEPGYGTYYGWGTVFSFDPATREIRTLHSFTDIGNDGMIPFAPLTDANGTLYGTTGYFNDYRGGGTIFTIDPQGHNSVIYRFGATDYNDGSIPVGSLAVGADGALYTTLVYGGLDNGTVFAFAPDRSHRVFDFKGQPGDGSGPIGLTLNPADGLFYGVTGSGGTFDEGTIYSITPGALHRTILHSFGETNASVPNRPSL